jgi:hypothetical protein
MDHVSTNFHYILDMKYEECMHSFVDYITENIQMNELDQLQCDAFKFHYSLFSISSQLLYPY